MGIIDDWLFMGMKPVWHDKVRNVIYSIGPMRQREIKYNFALRRGSVMFVLSSSKVSHRCSKQDAV